MNLEQSLRRRARRSRLLSRLGLISVLLLGAVLLYSLPLAFNNFLFNLAEARVYNAGKLTDNEGGGDIVLQANQALLIQNQVLNDKLIERSRLISLVVEALYRLSAVLAVVFIIKILIYFSRFHAQLAEHLEAVADSLILADGDVDKFKDYFALINSSRISFGQGPSTPVDEAVKLLSAVAKLKG
jgi:hypothetical protein